MAGFASATEPVCTTAETTFVSGVISDGNGPVSGADVTVTCNGNVETATSDANGGYSVQYTGEECPYNSALTVEANGATSSDATWSRTTNQYGCLEVIINVACVDITVPEFGAVVGVLTVLGALGTFLVVRRH
jgi:hypothetical protein